MIIYKSYKLIFTFADNFLFKIIIQNKHFLETNFNINYVHNYFNSLPDAYLVQH